MTTPNIKVPGFLVARIPLVCNTLTTADFQFTLSIKADMSVYESIYDNFYNSCPSSKLHVGQDGKAVQIKFTCTVKHLKPWML